FMALDAFAAEHGFPEFKLSKKYSALVSEGSLQEILAPSKEILARSKAVLVKPQAFMNNSGRAVRSLLAKLDLAEAKPSLANLVVVHDDIDIPFGEVRVVKNRGSAGHKGVESIIQELGTKDFTRIRIGILPETGKPKDPETFVLKKFTKEEQVALKEILRQASAAIVKTWLN
ncbi:aminoacyl-tRNA hydrolase, partial [Patescibacteria group bacterium]|nr:aminoacyl-tRNA hydrolase [Patescibacteria group bacterium]